MLMLVIVFSGIFLMMSGALISSATLSTRVERASIASTQALALAEAGLDKAIYELNQSSTYSGETGTELGAGTFTTTLTSVDSSTKRITVTGSIPSAAGTTIERTVRANVNINSTFVSFRYGVQVGSGGFTLNGGATINGSVYSNGDITATNGSTITGSAIAANPPATNADQTNDSPTPISSCTSSTCITFGNANATEDLAQSFQISSAVGLDSIQLYIKKVSTPSNATIRIVNDDSGSPGTDVLMTATLSASAVTTSFGWVSVTLPSTPVLNPGQTYWIVIDASSNASRYYIIGANTAYGSGVAHIGRHGSTWSNTSPGGLDSYFKIYLGGGTSMIGGNTYNTGAYIGTTASDEAWAHTVQGVTVSGPLYCQVSSYANKACDTSRADPTPGAMPLSDNNIQDWKDEAAAGGTISGDYPVGSEGATLGPKKIDGDLLVSGGGILNVTGTLWVVGTITVTGGGEIKLDSVYGANSGAIVTDGYVTVNGGGTFAGSGTEGSYPFLITTSGCPTAPECDGNNAVSLAGGAGTVAIVAQNGTAYISGGSALKAITAKQITMTGGATLNYDTGLINENFYSGPGGSWTYVPGTYVITQ